MSDYLIKFTDPAKLPFVVKPWTADGPISPSGLPLLPGAIAANTSLAIVGKGRFEYGDNVQENLVRMTEHFAYSNAPSYPIEGQIWYKNTTGELFVYDDLSVWNALVVSGKNTSNIDFNGVVIENIGTAVNATDALNRVAANVYYLQLSGGTMTGTLTLDADPVNNLEAATKQYVDNTVGAITNFVLKTGDVMSGPLTISPGSSSPALTIQSGSIILDPGVQFDGGGVVLSNITDDAGDPTSAVTRGHVDSLPIGDGVVYQADYDGTNDYITFLRVNDVPFNSGQIIQNTVVNTNPSYSESKLREDRYPTNTNIHQALSVLDKASYAATRRVKRYLLDNSTDSTITLPFKYHVETDRLVVFKNGVKLFREPRAVASVDFDPIVNSGTVLPQIPGYYNYNLTVDGAAYTNIIVDTTPYPLMYGKLLADVLRLNLNQHGFQTISFSTPLVDGTETTGLSALTYEAQITIDDDAPITISINGSTVVTINDLIIEIDNQLNGTGKAFVHDGLLFIRSESRGPTSIVSITDPGPGSPAGIFSSLTNFSAVDTATNGYNVGHTHGYQTISFSSSLNPDGSDATGLLSIPYDASVVVDNVTYDISIADGSSLPTMQDVIDLLNTQLATAAVADIAMLLGSPTVYGLRITSLSTGTVSTVSITDPGPGSPSGLFSNMTNFSAFDSAVDGTSGVEVIFEDDRLLFMSPTPGQASEITLAPPTSGPDMFGFIGYTTTFNNEIISIFGSPAVMDYVEEGTQLKTSNTITLATPLVVTDRLECLLLPGWIL